MEKFKVAVIGGHGGLGQPLSLLLKQNSDMISELNLLDIVDPRGLALDLSHIPNKCAVRGFVVPDQEEEGLTGADLVIFCIESGKITGHTRSSLFEGNAKPVELLMNSIAQYCPSAMVIFITNPVNSLVPLAVQVLANHGIDAKRRIIGITTLDYFRTVTFVSELLEIDASDVTSFVVGGHSGDTITPIITDGSFSYDEIEDLSEKIKDAGFAVYIARNNVSATLSIAAAGLRLAQSILSGLNGMENVIECAYVHSDLTRASYFASRVVFGREGVERILPLPILTDQQQKMVDRVIPHLEREIQTGLEYLNS